VDSELSAQRGVGTPAGLGGAGPQRQHDRLPLRPDGSGRHQRLTYGRVRRARRHHAGIPLTDVRCHDIDAPSAQSLAGHLATEYGSASRTASADEALDCDLVVLATTALRPHISADRVLRPGQLILNVSLRDLPPELLLTADNVLDDVEHCLKADTSPHLAEQLTGNRDFVTGTLAQVLTGQVRTDPRRATVFSPFGLGVLDLAVGHYVHAQAATEGRLRTIPDFFGETRRW
jgi:ornithine cyclodeaminase